EATQRTAYGCAGQAENSLPRLPLGRAPRGSRGSHGDALWTRVAGSPANRAQRLRAAGSGVRGRSDRDPRVARFAPRSNTGPPFAHADGRLDDRERGNAPVAGGGGPDGRGRRAGGATGRRDSVGAGT